MIGRKTIMVAMSTGCPLASWWAISYSQPAALVMLSPNFLPTHPGARLILTAVGPLLLRLLIGRYRDLSGHNDLEDRYWTTRHHSKSLITMMKSVQLGRRSPLEQIHCPTLVVYSKLDRVVSIPQIKRAYERIGSTKKKLVDLCGAENHELAGVIHNPAMIPKLRELIINFLEGNL
jgi:alpha-beta hydrolase superfamily lysophospholipase